MDLGEMFEWDEIGWSAEIRLSSWAGYQSRRGPYGSVDRDDPSDGATTLTIDWTGREASPLSAADLERVNWLLDHERDLHDEVSKAIAAEYPRFREQYVEECPGWPELPEVVEAADLKVTDRPASGAPSPANEKWPPVRRV